MYIDCNPEAEIGEGGGCNANQEDCDDDDAPERFMQEEEERHDDVDTTCNRYVLYAAVSFYRCEMSLDDVFSVSDGSQAFALAVYIQYIDPNYGGGGIGEYAFWDRHNQTWDTSACEREGTDCRKMDCHLPGTEFELLGFFKESSTRDFMDQLFKHEGYCTWFPEEYEFMQAHQRVWPEGCTPLNMNNLYMDVKPMPGGDWSIGIYTDEICTQDYGGSATRVIEAYAELYPYQPSHDSGNHEYGDLSSLVSGMDYWNDAMSFWKQCNPCRTYNIGNGQDALGYEYYDDDDAYGDDAYGDDNAYGDDAYAANGDDDANGDDAYAANDDAYAVNDDAYAARRRRRRRRLQEEGDRYTCNDDADYTNVNQCMKFYAKADMQVATFRNLELASSQGTIVEVDLNTGQTIGSNSTINAYFSLKTSKYPDEILLIFFFATLAVFVLGAASFVFAWRTRNSRGSSKLKQPLVAVDSDGVIA